MVVGVEDEKFGQFVRAAITVKLSAAISTQTLTLKKLRDDLRSKLTGYKMPTLLPVVEDEFLKAGIGEVQEILASVYFLH